MDDEHKGLVLVHVATVPESLFYFLEGQAKNMRERGIKVYGISSAGDFLQRFADASGALVYGVEMKRSISPLSDLCAVFSLYRIFRRVRPDIVHGHTPKGGLLAMISSYLAGVPVRIYQIHGLRYVTTTGFNRWLLKACERASCRLATRVFCVSHSVRAEAAADGVCARMNSRVVGSGSINGVDGANRFNPSRMIKADARRHLELPVEGVVIGFVGRIVRDKGIVELLAAWDALSGRFPTLRLLIAGPLELRDEASDRLIDSLSRDSRITYVGSVLSPSDCYAAMDVLALPTYREGFPLVVLEAAAMAIPVVATRVLGCIDSVQDGVTGTLVPARDPTALANALSRYVEDSDLRRRHGERGRQRALSDFRQQDIWNALFLEYHSNGIDSFRKTGTRRAVTRASDVKPPWTS